MEAHHADNSAIQHHPAKRDGGHCKTKVAAGEYATESEVIRDGLRALMARDRAVENWLRQEVGPAYDALKADPARAVSVNKVRASSQRNTKTPPQKRDAVSLRFHARSVGTTSGALSLHTRNEATKNGRGCFRRGTERVSIIGVFYGGQDFQTDLQTDLDE